MRIAILGAGHVGLTTGACFAHCGHQVTIADIDQDRIQRLRQDEMPFYEAHLDHLLEENRSRLTFTGSYADVADADVCLVAVPSPTGPGGGVDLSFVRAAAAGVAGALRQRTAAEPLLVVNKCTVPVGTGRMVSEIIRRGLEAEGPPAGKIDPPAYTVCSCPEFLREGRAVHDTLYPDRVVIGAESDGESQTLRALYQPIVERSFPAVPGLEGPDRATTVLVTSLPTAELIKYAANTFLAVKLSFINEIAGISAAVGASIQDVADGIGLDRRIGRSFLDAGIGWGGSCLGKDMRALTTTAAEYELPAPLLNAALAVNERQRGVVVRLLQEELRLLKGARITLLGLSFKPGTDDLRDAPSLRIAERLLELGAEVLGYDPVVRSIPVDGARLVASVADGARGADALVLVTEWEEFRGLPWADLARAMRRPLLIDGRNQLRPAELEAAGFRYRSIGR